MPRRAKIVLVSVVLVAGLAGGVAISQVARSAAAKSTAAGSTRADVAGQPTLQLPNAAPPLDLFTAPAHQPDAASDPANRFAATAPGPTPRGNCHCAPSRTGQVPRNPPTPLQTTLRRAPSKPAEAAVPQLPPSFSGDDLPNRTAPFDARNESLPDESAAPTHKIVDGDSLPLLAERYLGSATRPAKFSPAIATC